jgi:hypothetical protein
VTSFRPKRNQKPDRNHAIVSKVILRRCGGGRKDDYGVIHANLRGLHVAAYDMSGPGGEMVDWQILISWFSVFCEVKAEREVVDPSRQVLTEDERLYKMLKPGEVEFLQSCPAVTAIVTTEDQVWSLINSAADLVFAVEEIMQERKEYIRLFFPKIGRDILPKAEMEGMV